MNITELTIHILGEADCISPRIDTPKKGVNPSVLAVWPTIYP